MMFHVSLTGRKDLSGEIYRQMRRAVLNGRLRPGDRLPPTRDLARFLSVARMTVTVAYDRLVAEGLVTSRVGDGTYVSEHAVRAAGSTRARQASSAIQPRAIWDSVELPWALGQPAEYDFRSGMPDATLFPHEAWERLMSRALREERRMSGKYGASAGQRSLRVAIARHIGVSRGVEISPDDITIVNGTQQALDVITRVLLSKGDRIAVEDPGYQPPRRLFTTLGLKIAGVPVDEEGLVVDAIPRKTRAVYVTPSHQYPLGHSMSLARRQALLAWADRNDAGILEDDYDSEFRFSGRPLEPLQTLDTAGRVVYIGSFSKSLLPSLRLGYLITPSSLRAAVHKAKFVCDWHSATAAQTALALFLDSGGFARHIRRVSAVYKERRELVASILRRDFADVLDIVPSTAGLHLTMFARTASPDQISAIADAAFEEGVTLQRLSGYAVGAKKLAGFVIGYGSIATDRIPEGLRRLRMCFDRGKSLPGS